MNSKERKIVSEVIQDQIGELESSIGDAPSTRQQLSDHTKDNETRMEILSNASVNKATYLQMKTKLERLRRNLDWIQSEHGGECEACGRDIPQGRLLIVPTTRLCVNCSDKQEKEWL